MSRPVKFPKFQRCFSFPTIREEDEGNERRVADFDDLEDNLENLQLGDAEKNREEPARRSSSLKSGSTPPRKDHRVLHFADHTPGQTLNSIFEYVQGPPVVPKKAFSDLDLPPSPTFDEESTEDEFEESEEENNNQETPVIEGEASNGEAPTADAEPNQAMDNRREAPSGSADQAVIEAPVEGLAVNGVAPAVEEVNEASAQALDSRQEPAGGAERANQSGDAAPPEGTSNGENGDASKVGATIPCFDVKYKGIQPLEIKQSDEVIDANLQMNKVSLVCAKIYSKYNIHGVIVVQNIAYEKTVRIRYTTDEWATYSEEPAYYTMCKDSVDTFYFEFSAKELWRVHKKRVLFSINFKCSGQDYWDNNFNQNYVFQYFQGIPKSKKIRIPGRRSRRGDGDEDGWKGAAPSSSFLSHIEDCPSAS